MERMYKCTECEHEFVRPEMRESEQYGNIDYCPYCGSDSFDELEKCVFCEEWVERTDASDLCEKCAAKIDKELEAVVARISPKDMDYIKARNIFLDHISMEWA